MPPQRKSYPDPLIIPPLHPAHTHTLILLHGLGSNASHFGTELLESTNLPTRLPTVKFVFPTASKRRSIMLNRIPVKQWFDIYSLEDPGLKTELQIDGLCETAAFLRKLIENEANIFGGQEGYQKIILGGLSQGCAASVFTLLGGGFGAGNAKLGGFIGMSGWLPFEHQLRDLAQTHVSDNDDDPFASSEIGSSTPSNKLSDDIAGDAKQDEDTQVLEALNHIRDILDLPILPISQKSLDQSPLEDKSSSTSLSAKKSPVVDYLRTPAYIGHGSVDQKVSARLGEGMADFLSSTLRMAVTWKIYEGLGHWYGVPDEIEDIVRFLEEKVGVPVVGQ